MRGEGRVNAASAHKTLTNIHGFPWRRLYVHLIQSIEDFDSGIATISNALTIDN
jgi:hypothetical protein